MKEHVVASAIKHGDGTVHWLPKPARHHDIVRRIGRERWLENESRCEQGFITDTGRFVGREEALVIATEAGQIVHRCGGDHVRLYSENLW